MNASWFGWENQRNKNNIYSQVMPGSDIWLGKYGERESFD